MAVLLSGLSMPTRCEDCVLENYDPKSTRVLCSATGHDVAWCRAESRPKSCPLVEADFDVTECCPHCGNEVTLTWDVESRGYKAFCPVCGDRLMLCEECLHSAEPCSCDYSAETDSCRHNWKLSDLRVETPLGAILARTSSDPAHPGVWLDLRRPDADSDMTLALIEFSDDECESPEIVTRVWGDTNQEDYTMKIVHNGIEDFFGTEEAMKGDL